MSRSGKLSEELSVGDVVVGEVTKVLPFGVLVTIPDDVGGLLPGSPAASVGEQISVRIVALDDEKRRVSLAAL